MILGQTTPTASTDTLMYTVPASKRAAFFVNFVNESGSNAAVEVYLLKSGESTPLTDVSLLDRRYIGDDTTYATDSYVLEAGQKVYVKVNKSNVRVNVNGFEEDV